jgi:DNA excision repair protein ERCC-1
MVEQLPPQPLARPTAGSSSSILVSPRQRGNPILTHIKTIPWEYDGSITPDFVLGATTACLFLQLKYHKLHPEYVYSRISGLQGRYLLRLVLVLVDIEAHEESLKELTKTSVVNNVTILLAWSAHEAGRYLELFKSYEHAQPTAIKGVQSDSYVDRLVGFVTTPRGINKADAVGLVSNFGTVRTAVNAEKEELSLISGWGDRKVARWHAAVREPFRSRVASRKVLVVDEKGLENALSSVTRAREEDENGMDVFWDVGRRPPLAEAVQVQIIDERAAGPSENSATATATSKNAEASSSKKRPASPDMNEGVLAALSRLRNE